MREYQKISIGASMKAAIQQIAHIEDALS